MRLTTTETSAMSANAVIVENVSARYGDHTVLDDISLTIPRGASYALLGLISFLTAGSDECRAWTIKRGTKAPQAAGKIHTDFERGFIRAEVIAFEDMKAIGSMANAKAQGKVRSEGKEYVMKDGDIVNFLFNV